jgi:hypothetical protein
MTKEIPGGKQCIEVLSSGLAALYLASASGKNGTTLALSGFLLSTGSKSVSLAPPTRLGGVGIQIPTMSDSGPPEIVSDAFDGWELCANIEVAEASMTMRQQAQQPKRVLIGKIPFLCSIRTVGLTDITYWNIPASVCTFVMSICFDPFLAGRPLILTLSPGLKV